MSRTLTRQQPSGRLRRTRAASAVLVAFVMASVVLVLGAGPASAQDAPTIAVTAVDPAAGTIELTNYGDAEVDPNGIILCNFPAYGGIEGADVIAPGATLTIDSASHGVALDAEQGEMGLYLTPSYEDPTQLISYVEWGTPDHQRSPVAVEGGIWVSGVADVTDGRLVAAVANPKSPADWAAASADVAEPDTEEELAQTGFESALLAVAATALLGAGLLLVGTGRRTQAM